MTLGIDSNVHVANHMKEAIYVMPMADPGWTLADVIVDSAVVTAVLGFSGFSGMPAASVTFGNLITVLGGMGTMGTLAAALKKSSITIPAGRVENVFSRFRVTATFIASSIAGMLGAKTVSLLIVAEDGRTVHLTTDPDHSWIATDKGIVRAVYGTLNAQDEEAGFVPWVTHGAEDDTAELPVTGG
ncbi:hypothetical protein [Kitasatospora sp. NPDC059827]|uniref:hypothetical protein n=1 Tax=Kitasatospora sp. NPDC059827 TaxID=3346964 RepID=UPI00365C0221